MSCVNELMVNEYNIRVFDQVGLSALKYCFI